MAFGDNSSWMDESWFAEWFFKQATDDEKKLYDRITDFAELFEDFLFERDTITYKLLQCQSQTKELQWEDDIMDLPDELSCFSYNFFHYKSGSLGKNASEEYLGCFSEKTLTLTVSPRYLDNDGVILHEMTHLHEFVINQLPMYFHDMLYWALYQALKEQIPKLEEIITGHAHLLTGTDLYNQGGTHDILFLLKSFDLDIRMNYPLGTVFSYGRDKEFKNYTYIKKQPEE